MTRKVAVAGSTPTWRRGVSSILADSDLIPTELTQLSSWKPGRDGIAVIVAVSEMTVLDDIRHLKEAHPHIPVVAVVPELTVSSFAAAVRVGATGVLGDDEPAEAFKTVIEVALQARTAVPETLVRAMAARIPDTPKPEAWVEPREADWLRHLARGELVSVLAESVGYSEREMFRMLHDLYVRIGVRNRTEAIIWATRHGVLDQESTGD